MRLETRLKLRDAFQMAADALTEDIEQDAPPDIKNETRPRYDISKINTETAIGKNGEYKKATSADNMNNSDFDALVKDLEAHDGKISKDGLFMWKFGQFGKSTEITVGWKNAKR